MWRTALAALAIFNLSSCATTANYEKILDSWLGQSEGSLIDSWGPPDSAYETGNKKYLTYTRSSTGYVPGTAPTYQTTIIGSVAYSTPVGGSPGFSLNYHCKTTFTVNYGTINNWRYEGNNCVARAR